MKTKRYKLLLIALFIVGCDNSTEYEEPSVVEYPNQTGNSWTYACNVTIDDSLMESGYSFLKIIDNFPNNYSSDSCGVETIIFEKTDSIYFSIQKSTLESDVPEPSPDPDVPAPPSPRPFLIDSVKVDTLIYSMTEDGIAYCLSASSLNPNSSDLGGIGRHFHLSKPPKIQYPLFIGQSWEEPIESFEPRKYEVIGAQYVTTEIKTHNCYLIKRSGLADSIIYYYISSEGLIKSSWYFEGENTKAESPDGTGEIVTITRECILVNTNPL